MPNPFGLTAGETPSADVASYWISFHAVPKPHPDFKDYSGKWTPEHGLITVVAYSRLFDDDPKGHGVIRLYERLKSQLLSVYGAFDTAEFIDDDAVWSEDDEFVRSILADERCHFAHWSSENSSKLDAEIKEINLSIIAETADAAKVMLRYEFKNNIQIGPGINVGLSSL